MTETIARVHRLLAEIEIRHHFTGGLSLAVYGKPRLTQDIDLVVDRDACSKNLPQFFEKAKEGFLFAEDAVHDAVMRSGVFQLLDLKSSLKVDLYAREGVPNELDRTVERQLLPGVTLPFVSHVDAVISKLIWIKKGSARSARDVRWLYAALPENELSSVHQFATSLGLQTVLQTALSEDEPVE